MAYIQFIWLYVTVAYCYTIKSEVEVQQEHQMSATGAQKTQNRSTPELNPFHPKV
jgi:hypothetical protein